MTDHTMIRDEIQQALVQAMKDRAAKRLETLRFIMSDIKNTEIDAKHDLTDAEIVDLIQKQKKKLDQSMEMFEKAGRNDLVEEYRAQTAIMAEYLPTQLSDTDVRTQLEQFLESQAEIKGSNPKALIGLAMGHFKGKADPKVVLDQLRSLVPGI